MSPFTPQNFKIGNLEGFEKIRVFYVTHIELKSWLDRPSGTFILHGGPLRPVVRLVGRSSVEQLQDPGTSQLLLPGERERDPSLQRREKVKLSLIICLIDRKQASYDVSRSMADTRVKCVWVCVWVWPGQLITLDNEFHPSPDTECLIVTLLATGCKV